LNNIALHKPNFDCYFYFLRLLLPVGDLVAQYQTYKSFPFSFFLFPYFWTIIRVKEFILSLGATKGALENKGCRGGIEFAE
jgi:hypothetical protein